MAQQLDGLIARLMPAADQLAKAALSLLARARAAGTAWQTSTAALASMAKVEVSAKDLEDQAVSASASSKGALEHSKRSKET